MVLFNDITFVFLTDGPFLLFLASIASKFLENEIFCRAEAL